MIKIVHHKQGRYAPMLFCDICGKRIDNAKLAAVLTVSHPIHYEQTSEVMHVHKRACHDIADKRHGKKLGWEELSRHLLHLNLNVGLSPANLLALQKFDNEFGDCITNSNDDE